jgi:hypothetical protein
MTRDQIDQQLAVFRDRFGPAVLAKLEGEELLPRMHGVPTPKLVAWPIGSNSRTMTSSRATALEVLAVARR